MLSGSVGSMTNFFNDTADHKELTLEIATSEFYEAEAESVQELLTKHGITTYTIEEYTLYEGDEPSMHIYALVHEDYRAKNAEIFGQHISMEDLEEVDEEVSYLMLNYDDLVYLRFSTKDVPAAFVAELGEVILAANDYDESVIYSVSNNGQYLDRMMPNSSWSDMKRLLLA